MEKKKVVRLAGFVGALCASATLVGMSVSGTGAYFTDSHDGNINASTGRIAVTVSPASGQLNFTDLLPGEYQTKRVDYTAHPKGGSEDIWLVFPAGASSESFTGGPGSDALGRYGHFALASSAGATFTSYNLNRAPSGTPADQSCGIDANGSGGSNQQPTSPTDTQVPYCAPADAILLQSGMNANDAGYTDLTFGFTPLLRGGQDGPLGSVVSYKIVATQHGVRPDNPYN